jgi:hypothetical protein
MSPVLLVQSIFVDPTIQLGPVIIVDVVPEDAVLN